jgi:hypothetical protein
LASYEPPERVVLSIGAAHKSPPILEATRRLRPRLEAELSAHIELGLSDDVVRQIDALTQQVERGMRDPAIAKKDTPLQMAEVSELMGAAREWLRELRALATIELSLDAPTLRTAASAFPEIADPYPRDLLAELDRVLASGADLGARLEELPPARRVFARGRDLSAQLRTALGREDLDPANLHPKLKRHYMSKGRLVMLTARVARQGRYLHRKDPERAAAYHFDELDHPPAPSVGRPGVRPPIG